MEIIAKTVNAYDNGCLGCEKFNSDVMITITNKDDEFFDCFLTTAQAKNLIFRLNKVLMSNEKKA